MTETLKPEKGVRVPSRREVANLVERMVLDAALSDDVSVSQPLAEQFAQYLDAIYTALRFQQNEEDHGTR